jgi:uncharacterized protein DUF6174
MRLLICAAVVMSAAACDEIGPSDVKEFDRAAFTQARARWQSARIASYTVESRHACFCPAYLNFWTRLTVRDGTIAEVDPVEPLPSGISSQRLGWFSVPQLFDYIESAASSDDRLRTKITVSYDATLGYPKDVSIKCRETVADCDVDFFLRTLARTP